MSNIQNIYNQQVYRNNIIPQNVMISGPNSYGQPPQYHPIYHNQNQILYSRGVQYQQSNQIQQIPTYHQVVIIPQIQQNNFYQIPQQNQYQNLNQYKANTNQQVQVSKKNQIIPKQNIQTSIGFINPGIIQNQNSIKNEALLEARAKPMLKDEMDELYSYEAAICRIKCNQCLINGQIIDFPSKGTGFFCEIDDKNIPFRKALFTNNHVLFEKSIENNKEIIFEICNKLYKIKLTENRRKFTNKDIDYTCIEILDKDNITKFFKIDETIFNNRNKLINKEIFILQYPEGKLGHDSGIILNIKDNKISHSVVTESGSSGSPIIKRYNMNLVIGIHCGSKKHEKLKDKYLYNLAIPFDIIIKDIKKQLLNNKIIINILMI